MKTYKRRDSATTVLRKLGIKPDDYNLFITKTDDGFELDFEKAEKFIEAAKAHDRREGDRRKGDRRAGRETCCGVAYAMILDGATNEEVWAVIQPKFNLDEKKRHYPSWYRCQLRREGKIPQSTRQRKLRTEVVYA